MDLERAASIIKALPLMSKTIVDDTIYEKVLSFLTLVLTNHSQQEIAQLDRDCSVYQKIYEACIDTPDQDYRVIALCIRLMGQLVYYGGNDWFQSLKRFPDLLGLINLGIRSSEAALRCACIETCRLFVWDKEGSRQWLIDNKEAASFIMYTILDQSQFVVSETSQLFATLLRLRVDQLLVMMDPTDLIRSILLSNENHQVLSALDFCWTLVSMKDGDLYVLEFIRSKKLMHSVFPLLQSSNRMIRSRVLEILNALFEWDDKPLETLGLANPEDDPTDLSLAYLRLSQVSIKTIRKSDKLDQLTTSLSLLEKTFILLKRVSNPSLSEPAYDVLYQTICCCLDLPDAVNMDYIKRLLVSDRAKNTLIYTTIRAIYTLLQARRTITQIPTYNTVFDVLKYKVIYTDTRVLKEALGLLTDTLLGMEKTDILQETLLHSSISSLVAIMTEDNELDCKALSILLSSIQSLLIHDRIGGLIVLSGKELAEALCLKLIDTQWDVRDVAVHFVGQLFQEPVNQHKLQFGLVFNLPLSVFQRIHDSEAYVRASAIEVLEKMMTPRESWAYIQQHQVSKNLASKLPQFLHDTEAFVRRATLDAIDCLVSNRACQGMSMELKPSQYSLNPDIIKRLANDDDTEVRVRTCRLLKSLHLLYLYEMQQNKKGQNKEENGIIFFQKIEPAELLVEAVMDTSRVVRIEAVRVIESILSEHDTVDKGSKRPYEDEMNAFDIQFLNTLKQIDLDRQRQTLDPEHLYEETFGINADMMTSSIIPKDPEDDINMLDCY
ncbi:hypothetical protein A0J61_08840 [Choanephora cucurbitarum]|uniref:Uncharacterized protein n=1 Tax=Choanephora cucurbitarum TaxID=101091 RepID=A0A1C7N296_9FUNG|nr:hypothetical protein A0J61_08840 [Choanephora cucurbitarum]